MMSIILYSFSKIRAIYNIKKVKYNKAFNKLKSMIKDTKYQIKQ